MSREESWGHFFRNRDTQIIWTKLSSSFHQGNDRLRVIYLSINCWWKSTRFVSLPFAQGLKMPYVSFHFYLPLCTVTTTILWDWLNPDLSANTFHMKVIFVLMPNIWGSSILNEKLIIWNVRQQPLYFFFFLPEKFRYGEKK